jgi:cytoskeleton protein RodZ
MSEVESKGRERTVLPAGASTQQQAAESARPALTARNGDASFGRALAAAREARGLSQADVASHLRLHLRQVKAIEQEDLSALPEGPFVRGYVRSFARLVDLPAEPLLSLLNARLKPTDPLRAGSGGGVAVSPLQQAPREPMSGRMVVGGAVAALVMFAAFGWWTMRSDEQKRASAPLEPPPASVATPAQPSAPSEESQAATTAASAAEAATSAQPAAVTSDTALRLSFRDRSWVEIRQADGTVLLSQSNAPGSAQTIEGVPPYTLVIGNASKVDLEFRGKPVDLAASASRDDVARLRLE